MRPEPSLDLPRSSGEQLELQIPEPVQETSEASTASNTSETSDARFWAKPWTVPLVLFTGVLITLVLAIPATRNELHEPEQFKLTDSGTSVPARRSFPPIDLPDSGQVIQVGIFTKLSGAERKQIALTNLGLAPYVQKRITENGLQYAVLLGPLSASTHDQALATLTKNNYSYFHRPRAGS
jgi:cell division protein FtsN